MPITNLQVNWSLFSFNSVTLTKITQASFGYGGTAIDFSGDTDFYPTAMALVMSKPHASVTGGNVGQLMGMAPGTVATLTGTLADAHAVTDGAVVFTMTNSMLINVDSSGSHAQWGTSTATFQAISTDGATNPLTISRV
jgi:hypothetical protein